MKTLILICSFLFLSACCHNQVIDRGVIQPWPEPPVITRPMLIVDEANANDSDKIRNMSISIIELMEYSRELENSLNGYRKTPK